MTHGEAVFVGHYLGTVTIFWLWCWYQFEKKKRACRRYKRQQAAIRINSIKVYHANSKLFH